MAPSLEEPVLSENILPTFKALKVTEKPVKIVSPSAWDGSKLQNDNEYTYKLSNGEVAEIEQALHNFYELGLDGDEATKETFILPNLGVQLQKIAKELHRGKGFAVIAGLDPKKYSAEDNTIIFLGIGAYIGETRGMQTDEGQLFSHVRNAAKMNAEQRDRPIKDSNRFAAFHNDLCTDILAMQSRSSAEHGGAQLIASVAQIYNELVQTKPHIASRLLRADWPLDIRRRFCQTDIRPLLWKHESHLIGSVMPDALIGFDNMQRSKNLPVLSAEQVEALGEFQLLADRFKLSLPTREGDLTFINNHAVVHAREAFQDSEKHSRYLVRMWLKNEDLAWKLPKELEAGNKMLYYDEKLSQDWNLMPVTRTMFQVYERSAP